MTNDTKAQRKRELAKIDRLTPSVAAAVDACTTPDALENV